MTMFDRPERVKSPERRTYGVRLTAEQRATAERPGGGGPHAGDPGGTAATRTGQRGTTMRFHDWLIEQDACAEAIEWTGDRDITTAWRECERGDWMHWLAMRVLERPAPD